jgi:predicted small metal-binding protein
MRKGSKVDEYAYSVEITDLGFTMPFKASGNSLRELVRLVKNHVPTMVTYSKVYREMQENVGAYIALFTLPLPNKKIRRVVVQITSLTVTDEQIERFHARAATLPWEGPKYDKISPSEFDKIDSLDSPVE